MAVVGSAEIVVRAITNKVRSDIQRAFRDARPAVAAEGKAAGQEWTKGFGDQVNQGLGNQVSQALNRAGSQGASDAGKQAGSAFTSDFVNEVHNADVSSLGDNVRQSIVSGSERAFADVERRAKSAGGRSGFAFGGSFFSGSFASSTSAASKAFTQLLGIGNLLGPAIGVVVSGLSSMVSGLFAMGAAAGQAVGALAVLPGAMAALAQGLGAIKLAFSGIGTAVSAGMKAATTSITGAGTAARDAQKAIADAQQNLARAMQDAAIRLSDAQRGVATAARDAGEANAAAAQNVADAERDVLTAQQDVLVVQRELNQARQDAAETLQQLGFDTEGAALAEQRAGLQLQDAFAKLQEVRSLPADDRSRVEAELAFKEADLNYRQAKDRASDLGKEQKKAAKAGVEGSDEVLAVRQRINDSTQNLADSEQKLSDARTEQTKTARDGAEKIAKAEEDLAKARLQNARSIADAQDALATAQQHAADATASAATAANAYQDALKKLSPEAQKFVKYLVSLRTETSKLKAAAGEELFPKLQKSLEPIVNTVFPSLQRQLAHTGSLLGDAAIAVSDVVSKGEGLRHLREIMQANNRIFSEFTKKNDDGSTAVGNMADVALRLLRVIQPITHRFAIWIASMADLAAKSTDTKKEMDGLRGFFKRAGDVAAQFGRIVRNLFTALGDLAGAANPAGQGLLDSFEGATESLDKLVKKARKSGELGDFFQKAADNLRAIGRLANTIGRVFLGLGDNPGVAKFADGIQPAVESIGRIGDKLTGSGDSLANFVNQMASLFEELTKSNSLNLFLDTLTTVAKVLTDIVKSPVISWLLKVLAPIFALHRALAFALVPLSFFFRALLGGPIKVVGAFSKLLAMPGRLSKAFATMRTSGLKAGLAELKTGSDQTKTAFQQQMVVDEEKTAVLHALEVQALRTAAALGKTTAEGVAGAKKVAAAPAAAATAAAAKPVAAAAAPASARVRNEAGFLAPGGFTRGADAATKSTGRFGKSMTGLGKTVGKVGTGVGKFGRGMLGLAGGPLGIILLLLPVIIKAFIHFYKTSTGFRNFVDAIVNAVKEIVHWLQEVLLPLIIEAGKWFFDHLIKPTVPALKAFGKIVAEVFGAIVDFIKDPLTPTFKILGEFFKDLFNNVLLPVFKVLWTGIKLYLKLIITYWKFIFNAVKFVIMNVIVPLIRKIIIPLIKFLWTGIKLYLKLLLAYWKLVFKAIKLVWDTILHPVINAIIKIVKFLWDHVVKPYLNLIKEAFKIVFKAIEWVWNNILKPVFTAIKTIFTTVWETVKTIIDKIKDKFDDLTEKLGVVKDFFKDKIGDIKDFFKSIPGAIANAFSDLGKHAAGGLNAFIGFLNKYLIGTINAIAGKFGLTIPDIPLVPLAEGGYVRGPGTSTSDSIHARLSDGEFVTRAAAVKQVGVPAMLALNQGQARVVPGGPRGHGGFGAPFHWVGDKLGDAYHGAEDLVKKGVGKALATVVRAGIEQMGALGIKKSGDGFSINNLFVAVMEKLAELVEDWGQDKPVAKFHFDEAIAAQQGALFQQALSDLPADGAYRSPLPFGRYIINTGYPYQGQYPLHSGSDFDAMEGTPIYSIGEGYIRQMTSITESYGNFLIVAYKGFDALYAHMQHFATGMKEGLKLSTGQNIGFVGHVGHVIPPTAAGAHLHLEIRSPNTTHTFDPLAWLRKLGVKLAQGGVVPSTPGGILSVIGEGGHDERVEPLDRQGLSVRDKAIIDAIKNQGRGGDQFIVNPSPSMDELELAEAVYRRVRFRPGRGT